MKVQELLTSKEKWIKGNNANVIDKDGQPISLFDDGAVAFSILGAVRKCYGWPKETRVLDRIQEKVGCEITDWNDDPKRTFEDVQKLIKEMNI